MNHLHLIAACLAMLCTLPLRAADTVDIVKDGEPAAVIVVGSGPPTMVRDAAALLQRVIERSSDAKLAILEAEPEAQDKTVVQLSAVPGDHKLDKDGFVIAFAKPGRIEIIGGSTYGTLFGAQEFLERYLGVRWLLPGDLGEHIPRHATISIPRKQVKQEPAFFSRLLSGHSFGKHKPMTEFLTRQRMHGRMSFHHNLLNLYPASKYAETHPHFYPVINGKRYSPPSDSDYHWQPDLHAEGIVEEGVKNIVDFFDKRPDQESYSLGMNDTHGWDDSVTKDKNVERNSIGQLNLSDYYYGWANKIAEGVLAKHPDKYLGCLAYNESTDPPKTVGLNPRILPYVCIDRMFWADPEQRRIDIERTKSWMKVAPQLAWYDYIYGDEFYKAPRFYPHLMSEYLRFGHEQGVVAYYAEAYPMPKWTEGPKLYVLLRLLWDPYLDVDATLDDWYRAAVGDKAAPYLAEYYAFWEEFWTKRVPPTNWFKKSLGITCYLDFGSTGYFEALRVGEDQHLNAIIENVVAHAQTTEQKDRAKFIHAGWQHVRAEMGKYLEVKKLLEQGPPAGTSEQLLFSSDFQSEKSTGRSGAGMRDDWRTAGMPKGWGNWQRNSSYATFGWDRQLGHGNRGSLTLDSKGSDGQPLCFLRTVDVKPNTLYLAQCDVRTAGTDDNAGIGITLKWKDKDGNWAQEFSEVGQHLKQPTRGRWQQLKAYVRTPNTDSPRMVFMLLVDRTKKGRVWFDNVELNRLVEGENAK